jgi:hypothetical protein
MFSPYHTSGFYCATATKGFLTFLILTSVAINIPLSTYRSWFTFTQSTIFSDLRLEKYIASRCVFLDPKDVLCASVLLYHFRIFERRYGSMKFVSYLFGTWALGLAIELSFMFILQLLDIRLAQMPTGPWGAVFALFIPYFCDLPRVAVTHFWGVPFTGKSITYIIGLQMLSSSLESILLAVCGLLSGLLYRNNILFVQSWLRVPHPLSRLAGCSLGRLFYTPCPNDLQAPIGATLELQRLQHMERLEQQMMWAQLSRQVPQAAAAAAGGVQNGGFGFFGSRTRHQAVEPSEEQVQRLVEMGFMRERVVDALRASNNDTERAAGVLLTQ